MIFNKRKWSLGLVIVVILIAGAPYLTGQLVKRQFEDVLQVFSELDPINVQLVDYRAGWLKSTAKTRVTFKNQALPQWLRGMLHEEDLSVILTHQIQHGPFIPGENHFWQAWHVALARVQSQLYYSSETEPVLKIHSQFALNGNFDATIQGNPIVLTDPNGQSKTIWKGLHGTWHINRAMDQFRGSC